MKLNEVYTIQAIESQYQPEYNMKKKMSDKVLTKVSLISVLLFNACVYYYFNYLGSWTLYYTDPEYLGELVGGFLGYLIGVVGIGGIIFLFLYMFARSAIFENRKVDKSFLMFLAFFISSVFMFYVKMSGY